MIAQQKGDFDSISEGASEGALLQVVSWDLYRCNAFRVTGLAVDATIREINRGCERLRMLARLGGDIAEKWGVLPLESSPGEEQVREAEQRLLDPVSRLLDEFFWFWPSQAGRSEDEALQALYRGDLEAAVRQWRGQRRQGDSDGIAAHNLAVLAHAQALDLESAAFLRPLIPAEEAQRKLYWPEAFACWQEAAENLGFWSRFSERIRELDDPRLTTGMGRRLRNGLPLALLTINGQLALRAAERENQAEAQWQLTVMHQSGFDEGSMTAALQRVAQPVRERIKALCQAAGGDGDAAPPEHAGELAQRLLDQAQSLLAAIDTVLSAGDPIRDLAHDEVALAALELEVSGGNKTGDWKSFIMLLERTLPIAASTSVRMRIQGNIETVTGNLKHDELFGFCWFCKTGKPVDGVDGEVKMYGNVTSEWTPSGTQVRWQTRTLKVPRCSACKAVHDRFDGASAIGLVLGGLLGILMGLGLLGSGDFFPGGCVMAVVMAVIGTGIATAMARSQAPKGVKPWGHLMEFPTVKKAKEEGFQVGEEPPNVQS